MTLTNLIRCYFQSNDRWFFNINGLLIYNDRNEEDKIAISSKYWSSILVGADGYPTKIEDFSWYCIAGGDP